MRRAITFSLVALLASLTLMPSANAQLRPGAFGYGLDAQENQMQTRINRGINDGRLSSREASHLQFRLNQISVLQNRLRASNGLSFGERERLQRKLNGLNFQISRELNNYEHRSIGYWNTHRHWH